MTTSPPSLLSLRTRGLILILLFGLVGVGQFNRVAISVAGSEVFIPAFDITETNMGWVYTAFLIVYTIGMLPCGWLLDHFGAGRVLTWLAFGMGSFVVLTGLLGWVTRTADGLWLGLIVIRSLAGFCSAPLHPGAARVVHDLVPQKQRATANGAVTAGAMIGIAGCFPVFGGLMDQAGWQLAFILCGLAMIGYGILWRALVSAELTRSHSTSTDPVDSQETTGVLHLSRAGWSLFTQPSLWWLMLSYAAYGYFQYLFFYWMNYYFEDVLHVPTNAARNATFWILMAMGLGMALGGVVTDQMGHLLGPVWGRRTVVMTGMGMSAMLALLAVQFTASASVAWGLAVSMAFLGICEGVFWTTATEIGGKSRGLAGAFINTGGNVGGLISPVLTPAMADGIGWPAAIAVACGINALGALVWLLIKPRQ